MATEAMPLNFSVVHGQYVSPSETSEAGRTARVEITRSPEVARNAVVTTELSKLEQIVEYLKVLYK